MTISTRRLAALSAAAWFGSRGLKACAHTSRAPGAGSGRPRSVVSGAPLLGVFAPAQDDQRYQ
jgi:hypothetical protein